MLSSSEIHPHIIRRGLGRLILLSAYPCGECCYLTALSFRKLSPTVSSHSTLVNDCLYNIIALARDQDINIRKHASVALRDLCASGKENILFFKLRVPSCMVELVEDNDRDVQLVAAATLRHLASSSRITDDFSGSKIIQSVYRCISSANDDLRCQIAGLLASLSEHRECQSTMVSNRIVQAMDSLLNTDEHTKSGR